MVSVVEGFRWALLGQSEPRLSMFALSLITSLILLVSGAYFFRRMEPQFADTL